MLYFLFICAFLRMFNNTAANYWTLDLDDDEILPDRLSRYFELSDVYGHDAGQNYHVPHSMADSECGLGVLLRPARPGSFDWESSGIRVLAIATSGLVEAGLFTLEESSRAESACIDGHPEGYTALSWRWGEENLEDEVALQDGFPG